MKEQFETVVPCIKIVAGDSDEARKTATGHRCQPLPFIVKKRAGAHLAQLVRTWRGLVFANTQNTDPLNKI